MSDYFGLGLIIGLVVTLLFLLVCAKLGKEGVNEE